ncbi:PAS domain S-box protein [Sediminibacillus dalangtanensis]|uniref:histidine kinase n=1 Tax=Sediminibacillus dalangtanensis TaxID=2729421 RepID=A0ABX7VU98_9BACI|nr:ATP-binding protein [Sediminibacillus dalangtanensis]QTM99579.1 PAS domain S-box protein [Sediminibacillus dalangtanensis]
MKDFTQYIQESKAACKSIYGMSPEEIPFLKVGLTKEQLQQKQNKYGKVLSIVKEFMIKLIKYMDGVPTLIVTTDAEGYVLEIFGDTGIKQMVDSLGITIGGRFDEKDVGTNSVSLALKHGEPIGLIGDDHFHDCLAGVACYSAPFSYSDSNQLAGTVSIMTLVDYSNQFHLGLLSSAVDTIEGEIRLQEQNHKLYLLNQVLINSAPLGIIMTDDSGGILEYNPGAEEILGIPKEEVIPKGIAGIKGLSEYVMKALQKQEKVENTETTLIDHKNGLERICLVDVLPLYDNFHRLTGAFAQFRDMTSYHELQKQVIQSEKLSAVGKLGAGFAHEIRNPLASIIGLVQLLRENNEHNKYLQIITDELERMKTLVNQFVLLGKPTKLQKMNSEVVQLIRNTVDLMNSNARLNKIQIEFVSEEDELFAPIDESQVKQVLINFIKNAVEAMPDGGLLLVQLQVNKIDKEFRIIIHDEGEGMTPEEVESLGTPFFTTKERGLGMGIPICFDIVKAHNGSIEIESAKGRGTSIHLIFPLQNGMRRKKEDD